MYKLELKIRDDDAIALRDDLLTHYPLNTEPPVEPPIVVPLPPDPAMDSRTFRNVWGSAIEIPQSGTRSYSREYLAVNKKAGLSVAWKLPAYEGMIRLTVSRSSSQLHGIRKAVFNNDRGFASPLARQNWGTTSLRLVLDDSYSGRTVYFNVKYEDDTVPWDLAVQAYVSRL